ncbi:MAG: hypothetical protein JO263_00320 [Candidatus Eremiobacteraeota bacterium]|nr:hypothetical protein [Candidatus Eremiobacteraeota bacterium]
MNVKRALAITLLSAILPIAAAAGGRGGFARPPGGFDFHGDGAGAAHPQTATHSSTGPYGTNRTTTVNQTSNGYNRTTTANNGNYNRTSYGGANTNGNYYHGSNGSGPYGSYSHSGSGNAYNHTYSGSTTATNAWGQTYHSSTYANNGVVYHGATVTNPVYHGVWGWNGGYAWYPAPYYWGGGFWGAFAIGATSAAIYGSLVYNNVTYTSYQMQPSSPGAKLLASYQLTQTQCGPPNLVVIYGPNNSVICAYPNNLVSAGNYSVNSQTLTLVSQHG